MFQPHVLIGWSPALPRQGPGQPLPKQGERRERTSPPASDFSGLWIHKDVDSRHQSAYPRGFEKSHLDGASAHSTSPEGSRRPLASRLQADLSSGKPAPGLADLNGSRLCSLVRFGQQPVSCAPRCCTDLSLRFTATVWLAHPRHPRCHLTPSSCRRSFVGYVLDTFEPGALFEHNLYNSVETSDSSPFGRTCCCWRWLLCPPGRPSPDFLHPVELRWTRSRSRWGMRPAGW